MTKFKEVGFEQASDLVGAAEIADQIDLGSFSVIKLKHPTNGIMMVITSADGKACTVST